MKVFAFLFTSSIGRKIVMALTGLFLCLFLVVHLIGNLQLLKADSGYAFNKYALFMTTNPLIKTVSYGLYAMILLHAIKGLYLAYSNYKARKSRYGVNAGNSNSKWTSRNMAILGSIIFIFIGIHMGDFWREYKFGGEVQWKEYNQDYSSGQITVKDFNASAHQMMYHKDGENFHTFVGKDLYGAVWKSFSEWWISVFYVLSMFVLGLHLLHGFQSAFQTLGVNHPRYTPLIKGIGLLYSIIVPLLFAIIPLFVLLNGGQNN